MLTIKLNDRFSLRNKVSIVTGGCGFFGNQITKSLSKLNSKIILIDINKRKIDEIKKKNLKNNIEAIFAAITNEKVLQKKAKMIIKKYGKIDILVNNAAIDYKPTKKLNIKDDFENTNLDSWNKEINIGLTGAFITSKVFSKYMIKKKTGIILNIASGLSVIAPDQRLYSHLKSHKPISYSVIKHGLIGLTKYLASYLARYNIRVNAISPGGISNSQDKLFQSKINKLIPLGRMAFKNEYKEVIQFLCSDASSYLTGHNLIIDGGRSII